MMIKYRRFNLIISGIITFTLIIFNIYLLIVRAYTYSFISIIVAFTLIVIFLLTLNERELFNKIIVDLEEEEKKKRAIIINHIITFCNFFIIAFLATFYGIKEIYMQFFWKCG